MHPYVPYIINDINAACRTEPTYERSYPKSFEEEMEEIERWLEGEEYEHTFGYYCGLQSENFPPPEQLSNEELEIVNNAFQKMMFTWNLDIDLPKSLPAAFAYSLLVNTLNEKTMIPNDGFCSFDYCTGYAPDCIFKEYCSCIEFWNSLPDDQDMERTDTNEADAF